MKKLWILAAAFLWMSALGVTASQPAHAEKRVALVIGNNDYRNIPALRKAVNDARVMGDTLKQLGFNVLFAENQTRKAFSETMLAFDQMISPGDTAFFFFAGHGFEVASQNYLLPTDIAAVTQGQEELIRDGAFAAERVISRFQAKGARTSIFVFDACRNNPFEGTGTRAIGGNGGLAAMTPPEGVFVIFSAGAKQTALDRLSDSDNNANSVFTRNFVHELVQPGANLVQIAKRTQTDVRNMTAAANRLQTPAYYDQIVGDFVLQPLKDDERAIEVLPKVAALPVTPPSAITGTNDGDAPIAGFMRHNGGWSVTFSLADAPLGITWRMGDSGEFRETGFLDTIDPRTRRRMPNPTIELPNDAPAGVIQVRYIDPTGDMKGPFPIRFDPDAALINSHRKLLDMTATSWLAFGGYSGPLVYYSQILSYRCAVREMRIGIDTTTPSQIVKLPPCNPKDPSAMPENYQPYLKIAPTTKMVSVELTYQDGSVSEIKSFKRQ